MAPQQVHVFRLTAGFGPADVFRALQATCADAAHAADAPAFEFNWIKRRLAISAASPEGLESCLRRFLALAREAGADDGAFLPGKMEEKDGRFVRPIGAMVMDPASLAELVGRTMVEIGMRGVRIRDSADGCTIEIARSFIAERIDYAALVMEFPLPPYVRVEDLGMQTIAPPPPKPKSRGGKGKRR